MNTQDYFWKLICESISDNHYDEIHSLIDGQTCNKRISTYTEEKMLIKNNCVKTYILLEDKGLLDKYLQSIMCSISTDASSTNLISFVTEYGKEKPSFWEEFDKRADMYCYKILDDLASKGDYSMYCFLIKRMNLEHVYDMYSKHCNVYKLKQSHVNIMKNFERLRLTEKCKKQLLHYAQYIRILDDMLSYRYFNSKCIKRYVSSKLSANIDIYVIKIIESYL